MAKYFERYCNGDCEEVWAELLARGAEIRHESIFNDALAVANETMRRVKINLQMLIPRLYKIDYKFKYPEQVYVPPKLETPQLISKLERSAGIIPLSLCAWYEIVGSVCLIGSHPQLADYYDEGHTNDCPYGYTDPLVVAPVEYALNEYECWKEDYTEGSFDDPVEIPISPDDYHKANVSGGSPYNIALPDKSIDAVLLNTPHETTFVSYLRTSFRYGGFAGFETQNNPTELISFLTKDFISF